MACRPVKEINVREIIVEFRDIWLTAPINDKWPPMISVEKKNFTNFLGLVQKRLAHTSQTGHSPRLGR